MWSIATATRIYADNGMLRADIVLPPAPSAFRGCPVLTHAAGGRYGLLLPAETEDERDDDLDRVSTQVVVLWKPRMSRPVVIGMLPTTTVGLVDETPEDPGDADHDLTRGRRDIGAHNTGGALIVDANGAVTIQAGEAGYVRIQVPADGTLRVSENGDAEETIILADAFVDDYVNGDLNNHLTTQDSRITELENAVNALIALVGTPWPVSTTGATVQATPAAPYSYPFAGQGPQSPPTAGDDVKSGTIQVPSVSKQG